MASKAVSELKKEGFTWFGPITLAPSPDCGARHDIHEEDLPEEMRDLLIKIAKSWEGQAIPYQVQDGGVFIRPKGD